MEKSKQKAIIFIGVVMILFYWFLQNLTEIGSVLQTVLGIFWPFLLGGALAFVFNVPMRQIEKRLFMGKKHEKLKKYRRPVAYVMTLVLLILLITAIVWIVVPELANTIADLINQLPKSLKILQDNIDSLLSTYPQIQTEVDNISLMNMDWNSIVDSLGTFVSNGTKGLITSGIGVVSGVVSGVVTFFIAFVFSIYILFQKENLARQCKKVLYAFLKEKTADKIVSILKLTEHTFASFLSGQCLEAVILGSLFVITMLIIQLPYAWLIGIIIAVSALIPLVGAFMGCFIGAFLILMVSPVKALIFVVMFLILQQIEGNLIYPHVVGKSVGLPGMWVLVAVTVGGSLFGVAGMLLFIPLCSVVYVLFKGLTNKRLREKKINIE